MKKIFLLLCFVGLMMSFKVLAQETQTVRSEKKVYTIELPTDWVYANEANAAINLMYITDPEYPDERLSISVSKGGRLFDLKEVYEINSEAIADFDDFELLEEGTGQIGDQDCMWLICTWTSDDGRPIKGNQYSFKYKSGIFCVQYHVDTEMFDTVQAPFDKVISTMVLL